MTLDQVTTADELIALIGTQREFYSTSKLDSKKNPVKWRLNGAIKTFKRDSTRIRIPLKHGLYDYDRIESVADFKANLKLKP